MPALPHPRVIKTAVLTALLGFVFIFSGMGSLPAAARLQGLNLSAAIKMNTSGIQGFHMVLVDQGWLLLNNRLYWSTNGGAGWKDITPSYSQQATIADVNFIDENHGWVVLIVTSGDDPVYAIARTADAGSTWQTEVVPLFSPGDVSAIAQAVYLQMLDSQTGWLVIKQSTSINFSLGTLFRTADGGHTWTRLTIPIGEPVTFINSSIGWVAGGAAGDELYRTQDGGSIWQSEAFIQSRGDPSQQQVYLPPKFSDPDHGLLPIMIANGKKVRIDFYITSDGGQSWGLDDTTTLDGNVDVDAKPALTLFDPDHFVLVVPRSNQIIRKTDTQTYSSLANTDGKSGGVVEVSMASQEAGWGEGMSGGCSQTIPNTEGANTIEPKSSVDCTQTIQLLRTVDGGMTWLALPLPSAISAYSPFAGTGQTGASQSNFISYQFNKENDAETFAGSGYDECDISSLSQMQAWWSNGPYAAVNLYIGGSSRACANAALTASFVAQLNQQGWKFMPIWVGPQAACSSFKSRMSYDPTTAYNQGVAEADSAISGAGVLSLTDPNQSNTIIYYDLEAYNQSDTACKTAAKSFISGWTTELSAKGNRSGVYGTPCSSALTDFESNPHVPDAVWIARWSYTTYTPSATVWGGSCITDKDWANHQRIRQYAGAHNETWGGVTQNIDSDVIDGILAVPYQGPGNTNAPTAPANPKPADGTTLDRSSDTWLYWSSNGTSCSIHVWGGSIDLDPSGNCSSLELGQQRGGAYSWQVTASNRYGSTTGPVWHFNIQPQAPTNLTASAASSSQINLAWTLSTDEPANIDKYKIYINGNFIANLPSGTVSTTVSGLTCNTSYSFSIRSVRQTVQSVDSNTASATTAPCTPGDFGKISPINAAPAEPTDVTLSWGESANADSYQYCLDTSGDNTCDGSWTSTTSTSSTLNGLTPGTTYYWQVQAVNSSGTTPADGGTWWSFIPSNTPMTVTVSLTSPPFTPPTPTPTNSSTPTPTFPPTITPTPTQTPTATIVGGFSKVSPGNGTSGIPASVTLQWQSVSGATAYLYCYDTLNNNTCDTFWTITFTNTATIGINPSLIYYWQVEAVTSTRSVLADNATWWSFTGSNPAITPVPPITPTFTPTSTAASGTLTPSPTATPSKTASLGPSVTPTSTPTATPTSTRSLSPTPGPSTSATQTPTLTLPLPPTQTPTATLSGGFSKVSPGNGASGIPASVTLQWQSVSGATAYLYCYDTLNNNVCDTFWTITFVPSAMVGINPNLIYYWQVEVVTSTRSFLADNGAWWSFTGSNPAITPVPPTTPTFTPTFTAVSGTLTPSSTASPSKTASLGPSMTPTSTPTAASTSTRTFSPTPSPSASATRSLTPTFTPTISPTATQTPMATISGGFSKVSPGNGASGIPASVTLQWQSVSGATAYLYCYDTLNNNVCDTFWTITFTNTTTIGINPSLIYYWQVEVLTSTASVLADNSTWWSFTGSNPAISPVPTTTPTGTPTPTLTATPSPTQ